MRRGESRKKEGMRSGVRRRPGVFGGKRGGDGEHDQEAGRIFRGNVVGRECRKNENRLIQERGGGRERKVDWRWQGKRMEEAKEFKYLGYMFKKNGGQEAHIRDRIKKAGLVMRQVWGIGKGSLGRTGERGCGSSPRWCGRWWDMGPRYGGGGRGKGRRGSRKNF